MGGAFQVHATGLLSPPLPFCLRPSSRHVTPRPRACASRPAAAAVSGLRQQEWPLSRRRWWPRPRSAECGLGVQALRKAREAALFSLSKGLVKPVAERQDEFPPWGNGGSECRTPTHRSRDGERSPRVRDLGRVQAVRGRRTRGLGGHLPLPAGGPESTYHLPYAFLPLPKFRS